MGNAYERMPIAHLCRFLNPVLLKNLPRRHQGGFTASRWALFATIEEYHGLLVSPGHAPYWHTTDKGTARCLEYLVQRGNQVVAL